MKKCRMIPLQKYNRREQGESKREKGGENGNNEQIMNPCLKKTFHIKEKFQEHEESSKQDIKDK